MLILVLFSMCVLMTLGMILITNNSKLSYLGASFVSCSICLPLLYFVPNPVVDLSRYFDEMYTVSQFNNVHDLLYFYNHVQSDYSYHAFTFIYDVYQWLIARTGLFNLLPFISAFIVYLCLLIPFVNLKNKYYISLNKLFTIFLSIFVLFTYDGTSSTIRWYFAAGIFFLITYIYFYHNNKYKLVCLLLYLPLIYIHEAIILPVILIIICTFIRKIRLRYIFITIFLIIIGNIVIKNSTFSSNNFNFSKLTKIYENMSLTSGSVATTIRLILSVIVPIFYSIICILMLLRNKNKLNKNMTAEINAFVLINIIGVVLLPFMVMFQRYVLFIAIFDIMLILKLAEYHIYMSNIMRIFYDFAIFLGAVYFIMGLHGMGFNFSRFIIFSNIYNI